MPGDRKKASKEANVRRGISTIVLDDSASVTQVAGPRSIAYFCKRRPVRVDDKLIGQLKECARKSGNRNVRLCLHESPDALFHNMLILEHKGNYYRPHKHLTKGESFHIIEGSMGVFTFDEKGDLLDSCLLGGEANLIYRVGVDMFHAVMPLSDVVIYHETKPGPFLGERDSIFSLWSPDPNDREKVAIFKNKLRNSLGVKG